jgi:RNA polymerase sigma-70 factor (ECF subfamily)
VPDPLSDALLAVARQDRAAFRTLYRLSAPKLAGVVGRMLRERAEAEDVLQQVYIRVWERAAQFDPARGQALSWLIAVARNAALDRLRARQSELRRTAPAPAGAADPFALIPDRTPSAERQVIAAQDTGRLLGCLDELEQRRAAALRGAYLEGMSYQDLASRYDVPLNTMRTWLRRSLLQLRECMDR